jgi:hypothetical protein
VRLVDVEEVDAHILERERLILGRRLALDAALHLLDLLLDLLARPASVLRSSFERILELGIISLTICALLSALTPICRTTMRDDDRVGIVERGLRHEAAAVAGVERLFVGDHDVARPGTAPGTPG